MSKALEIATRLEERYTLYVELPLSAAAELRRLHELNAELVQKLEDSNGIFDYLLFSSFNSEGQIDLQIDENNRAIAKAKEQS